MQLQKFPMPQIVSRHIFTITIITMCSPSTVAVDRINKIGNGCNRYCECFATGSYCDNCNCKGCCNNAQHEKRRKDAIEATLERNPRYLSYTYLHLSLQHLW
jgi:hypothetical protein